MLVWRLARAPYADLSGGGVREYGGRWNSPGRQVVYTADSAALAVLEVRVHLDLPPELVPDDYMLMTINLADLPVEDATTLPADPQAFGDAWLREQRTPVLRVPSLIVPEGANYLLNPLHPQAAAARMVHRRDFAIDPGLWLPL